MTPQHEDGTPGAFQGVSETGVMQAGPDADAISILQRVRDGLLREPAKSGSDEGEEAA